MRVNEYNNLDEFIREYIGIWNPSEKHWLGLDFKYQGIIYRLNTGSMYNMENTILPNGKTALFSLYQLVSQKRTINQEYYLLEEFANMHDLLECEVINGKKFKDIIMDDSTEILGKD